MVWYDKQLMLANVMLRCLLFIYINPPSTSAIFCFLLVVTFHFPSGSLLNDDDFKAIETRESFKLERHQYNVKSHVLSCVFSVS